MKTLRVVALAMVLALLAEEKTSAGGAVLRVCADPLNLPLSNQNGEGFENRIAEVVAKELHASLEYTWRVHRRGFLRNTLHAGTCDVVMGLPAGLERVRTTKPYYRSTFAFVTRRDDKLVDLRSFDDPRLRSLTLGIPLVGDDGANPLPAHALARRGMTDNVRGFSVFAELGRSFPAAAEALGRLKTGRMRHVEALAPRVGKTVRNICPSANGGKDWQPMSFSPKTGLFYIPHQNECMDEEGVEANYIAGTPYVGANVRYYAGPGGHRGELTAWNPVLAKPAWKLKESFPVWSGTVVTAGDVVFFGTMDGWFKCVDARTGSELWKFKTDSGIVSQPVTYRGPDGKQYVAVLDGVGGWAGAVVAGDLDPRDQSAALGMANLMGDLKKVTKKGGAIYVFALP